MHQAIGLLFYIVCSFVLVLLFLGESYLLCSHQPIVSASEGAVVYVNLILVFRFVEVAFGWCRLSSVIIFGYP